MTVRSYSVPLSKNWLENTPLPAWYKDKASLSDWDLKLPQWLPSQIYKEARYFIASASAESPENIEAKLCKKFRISNFETIYSKNLSYNDLNHLTQIQSARKLRRIIPALVSPMTKDAWKKIAHLSDEALRKVFWGLIYSKEGFDDVPKHLGYIKERRKLYNQWLKIMSVRSNFVILDDSIRPIIESIENGQKWLKEHENYLKLQYRLSRKINYSNAEADQLAIILSDIIREYSTFSLHRVVADIVNSIYGINYGENRIADIVGAHPQSNRFKAKNSSES